MARHDCGASIRMSTKKKFLEAAAGNAGGGGGVYVDDVFSTYLYAATRTGDTGQKITNGINLLSNTGKSLEISASNYISYGRIPAADFFTNNWTMEMFLRCSSLYTSSAGQIVNLIVKDDVSTRSFQWRWYLNKFEFLYWNTTSGVLSTVNFGTYGSFPLNQWLHVRLCKSGSTLYMYVDGTRIGTASITDIRSGNDPLTVGCYLGGGSGDKSYNIGYVSNVRIVNGSALSTGTSFTVPTTPLTKVNNTSLLMAQYPDPFLDSSNNKYAISDGDSQLSSLNPPITLPTDDVPLGGGLVWIKNRLKPDSHKLVDMVRGANKEIESNTADLETLNPNGLTAFHADGFSVGGDDEYHSNNEPYVSWTFKKQPGFFDIVTYTGDGTAGRTVSHNLGSVPGMIIVKRTDSATNWPVYHRSLTAGHNVYLNLDVSSANYSGIDFDNVTSTSFDVGNDTEINASGGTYVAYLFAHDAQEFGTNGNESIIKCGSLTTDGSGIASVNLGWEPQYVLIKCVTNTGDWFVLDNIRGWVSDANDNMLYANNTAEEVSGFNYGKLTSTGFETAAIGGGQDFVYIAIRRPHKPASEFEATDLFAVTNENTTDNPRFTSGFPVDFAIQSYTPGGALAYPRVYSRLTQGAFMSTSTTAAESATTNSAFDFMEGFFSGLAAGNITEAFAAMFRRAPGFFDVVCYEGSSQPIGADGRRIQPHNLRVPPELVILKSRENTWGWWTWHKDLTSNGVNQEYFIKLETTDPEVQLFGTGIGPLFPDAANFYLATGTQLNEAGFDYIALLFASAPGICDIGSYTGTGSDLTIDCGFSGSPRFVLVKRVTGGNGNWQYWDSARGITTGTDPYLVLNANLAQTTDPSRDIEPTSSGFIVNGADVNNNASGSEYIYMAIA